MIRVDALYKSYTDWTGGRMDALGGVSFVVSPGEIYGLLGPNGAGKTTTLRILATLLRPSAGRVEICGHEVVAEADRVRQCIGFVSSTTAMYDRMTAWETVEHFGLLCGLPKVELRQRMEALFARLHINGFRDLLGGKMSTGMKQKVLIARALVHDPPVLIFDEPTTGLDVVAARAVLRTAAELRDQGKCIVFSTHTMREAERLCDRIAVMHAGSILVEGTLTELRARHGQDDLEELFFRMILDSERRTAAAATTGAA